MIVRHGLLYIVARFIPGILGVATTSVLTRLLTPDAYGAYGLVLIVMGFGSTIAFEWLGLSFMRFYQARQSDPRTIPTFVALYFGMVGVTALVLMAGVASRLVQSDQVAMFVVGLCMAWGFAIFELLARFEIASFRPLRYLALNLIRSVLLLVFTLGAAWLTRDALYTAIGNAIGLAVAVLPAGRQRLVVRRGMVDRSLAREVVQFGLPFALSMLLAGLFTSGVRSLVAILTDTQTLGLYTAAYSLSQNVLSVVAAAIGSAIYPLAVRAYERGDPAALRVQLEENFGLLLGTMAPAALGMALTAHDLVVPLVGTEFRAGVATLMPWMASTVLFGSIRGVYLDHSFQLGKQTGQQVIVSAVGAGLALLGTVLLVPWLGATGAPIATTIAMIVSCVHAWVAGRAGQPMPIPARVFAQVGLACLVMTAAVLAVPSGQAFSLYAKVGLGMSSYAAVCAAVDLIGLRGTLRRVATRGAGRFRRRFAG